LLSSDEVHLAGQARDPEAVNDVGGLELHRDGLPNRHADLIRGYKTQMRTIGLVLNLPPPLMTGDLYRRRGGIIGEHRSLGAVTHDREGQHGNRRGNPGSENDAPGATLKGLVEVERPLAERSAPDQTEQQHQHHGDPDRAGQHDKDQEDALDLFRLSGLRIERRLPSCARGEDASRNNDQARSQPDNHFVPNSMH